MLHNTHCGINRIRLEFKAGYELLPGRFKGVLIESDWNLKQCSKKIRTEPYRVLIESDWNLNTMLYRGTPSSSCGEDSAEYCFRLRLYLSLFLL